MISIIVAMDRKRAIGKNNSLPWYLPADLIHFKKITTGHSIIMGRRTFDSIGRALPKRTNVVITRDPDFSVDNVFRVSNIEEAVELAQRSEWPGEIFIIGGGEIYNQAMKLAEKLYVTLINTEVPDADIFFPEIDQNIWKESEREDHLKDSRNKFDYSFLTYTREVKK